MNRRKALENSGILALATLGAPSVISMLQSCQTQERLDWRPKFLSEDEARTISKLVDLLLPATDTPGALDVKVDIFMDQFFEEAMDETGQQQIRKAIAEFNEQCEQKYGKQFADLDASVQQEVMRSWEASPKFNPGVWGTAVGEQQPISFYRSLKSMALWAYMSSEEVGKNILSYDPIPTEYRGCISVDEVGNRWSL